MAQVSVKPRAAPNAKPADRRQPAKALRRSVCGCSAGSATGVETRMPCAAVSDAGSVWAAFSKGTRSRKAGLATGVPFPCPFGAVFSQGLCSAFRSFELSGFCARCARTRSRCARACSSLSRNDAERRRSPALAPSSPKDVFATSVADLSIIPTHGGAADMHIPTGIRLGEIPTPCNGLWIAARHPITLSLALSK